MVKKYLSILLVALGLVLVGCQHTSSKVDKLVIQGNNQPFIEKQDFILDTLVSIKLYDFEDETVIDEALDLCREYENMLSSYKEGSLVYEINQKGRGSLPDEGIACIKEGIRYGKLSNHRFDISIFPVSSKWDFTSGKMELPNSEEIDKALPFVDYQKIQVSGNEVILNEGMGIDLGGIAKGFIADRLKEFLISRGVQSGIINLGGNNLCVGSKPNGEPFKIGIQRPFAERNEIMAIVDIKDFSVVTSGIYERGFEKEGKFYHHILDSDTGYPVENNLESLTIISPKSVDGDGLSTSCFLLGIEEGKKLVEAQENCYAIFVTKDNEVILSKGLEEAFNLQLQ